jgi:Activator of Hsp90 ATPase homolog 1-like protein
MTNTATETRSVVVEREIPYPPEKVRRALTQPHLIEESLMKNDFKPVVDHRFNLRADWGAVDCQVMAVEPNKTLSYTWAAYGLESVVTWTLTATSAGPTCAWSSRASGRISSRPTKAPSTGGSSSSVAWNALLPGLNNFGVEKGGDLEPRHQAFDSSLDSYRQQHSDHRLY